MKKLYTLLLLIFVIIAAITEQGCNILSNLFLNLPIKQTIATSGSDNVIFETESFCLSDYEAYNDNVDEVQSIKYVAAAYFTESYSPSDLNASNIVATLYASDGFTVIFQVFIPYAEPDDYVNNPYEIELTPEQIALFNQLLADYENNDCYTAELRVQDVSGSSTPYQLTGRIEIVVELEIKP